MFEHSQVVKGGHCVVLHAVSTIDGSYWRPSRLHTHTHTLVLLGLLQGTWRDGSRLPFYKWDGSPSSRRSTLNSYAAPCGLAQVHEHKRTSRTDFVEVPVTKGPWDPIDRSTPMGAQGTQLVTKGPVTKGPVTMGAWEPIHGRPAMGAQWTQLVSERPVHWNLRFVVMDVCLFLQNIMLVNWIKVFV